MKTVKAWLVGMTVALAVLMPLQEANAWDRSGYYSDRGGYGGSSHRGGGGYYNHRGGGGYSHRGGRYHGHRGYSSGAAVAGLAIGTIVGAAMANASRPPVLVAPGPYYPPAECQSVRVNGVRYYNCDGY